MQYANAYQAYQHNRVSVESPAKLIEMLYEGILRFSSQAKRCIENEDIEKKIYYINRVTDIFTELLNILDYEKRGGSGDISYRLIHPSNQSFNASQCRK